MNRIGCARLKLRHYGSLLLIACALVGCGGGGSSAFGSSGSGSSASGSNVVTVTVDAGPTAALGGSFNIPSISVTLCQTGTTTCATIDHVLVDTGSSGVRILASALAAAGLNLTPTTDPSNGSATIAECGPFADGYTWGPVTVADIEVGGEKASGASINIIDDNSSYANAAPSSCTSFGASLNSVMAWAANGVIGVGLFAQDCGNSCGECGTSCGSGNDVYYSCAAAANNCAFTPVALSAQVDNPVYLFATDNNGSILRLPSISAAGATTATGSLIFGIGTQSNNALGSATVLTTDEYGDIVTVFNGQTLTESFIDSGSNAFFFPDSSLATCPSDGTDDDITEFYCPASTVSLTATNQGQNGATSAVSFQIASLDNISNSEYAINDVGGSDIPVTGSSANYFDFGVPFFYGRSVYTAIEGLTAGTTVGPYVAY